MPDLSLTAAVLLLCGALYTDLLYGIIPNRLTVGFAGVGLLIHSGIGPFGPCPAGLGQGVLTWAAGLGTGGILFLIPYVQNAAGGGDLKLFAAIGALTSPWTVCQILLFACVAWGVLGLVAMAVPGYGFPGPRPRGFRSHRLLPFSLPAAAGFIVFVFTGGI